MRPVKTDTNPKPVDDTEDEESAVETNTSRTDERLNATETARNAITAYKKLSPTMRAAVRGAARQTAKGPLLVGWTGHVAWRTKSALAKRNIIRLSDNALTDFGRFVHAVAVTSEAEVLAWAAQKDEDAKPRQGHHNRTDENGIVHRVDVHRRALCDIELEPATVGTGNVMCFACIDAMFPDERDRARYLGQRPDIARAAGLKGLDAAYERTAALAESMSMECLVLNIENRRRWAIRDAYAAEELHAYVDALHALALVENTERKVVEVANQLGARYFVRRVNESEFFAVVDADHQNRTVSGMTRDLDEAKAWQCEAHRQWAERVVNERASASTLLETAQQRVFGEAAVTTLNSPTDQPLCANHHERRPAIAVLVYIGQSEHVGSGLCRECATCTDSDCDALGDVMDAEYEEPWCQRHADAFGRTHGPDECVTGPDIALLDSDRYRALIAENVECEAAEGRSMERRSVGQGFSERKPVERLDTVELASD